MERVVEKGEKRSSKRKCMIILCNYDGIRPAYAYTSNSHMSVWINLLFIAPSPGPTSLFQFSRPPVIMIDEVHYDYADSILFVWKFCVCMPIEVNVNLPTLSPGSHSNAEHRTQLRCIFTRFVFLTFIWIHFSYWLGLHQTKRHLHNVVCF